MAYNRSMLRTSGDLVCTFGIDLLGKWDALMEDQFCFVSSPMCHTKIQMRQKARAIGKYFVIRHGIS